ncbi:hypothetical protein A3I42_01760 [Candidatus Uhrbacteria bacterium RIFCSPLOWO2_02_FULL_49_11]|uniref:Nucleotidyltransferase n=1 Tax=Candidatus Uhrbacteria bacterium RIFCSPLOWO2_02_FULL_49_11 TaxID=1802409 RepID=A0A1F7VCI1_9BACT|nr:MAG: hypothetical protein A3I42_01760 [Candidatus Uhrbacteria bacterium RIFCSPLOWO2_02_FULL_49_11]
MAGILEDKLAQCGVALLTLEEALREEKTEMNRDATIQRFEYTAETFWKILKAYLEEQEKVEAATPKRVIREARHVGVLSEEDAEIGLQMIEDRNQSTHLYSEVTANEIYERIPQYAVLIRRTVEWIRNTTRLE